MPVVGKINEKVLDLLQSDLTRMKLQDDYYDWSGYSNGMCQKDDRSYSGAYLYFNTTINPTMRFYFNCHPYITDFELKDLIDYNAIIAYGDGDVAIYGGLPIFKATSGGEVTMKIKFKSVGNHDVRIGLKNHSF